MRKLAALRPSQGRPAKHGGRMLQRVLDAGEDDRRTKVMRAHGAIQRDLAEDEGGLDALSEAQRLLLPVIASEALALGAGWREVHRCIRDGKPLDNLNVSKWLLTLSNTFGRHLETFRGLRPGVRPEKSLTDYLAERSAAPANTISVNDRDRISRAPIAPETPPQPAATPTSSAAPIVAEAATVDAEQHEGDDT